MANRRLGGLLLAFQFFSSIPVHKEIPMKKPQVTAMYCLLPVVGLMMGAMASVAIWLMKENTDMGPLMIAFLLASLLWAITGGLHMDGLADTGDAYFSYQDKDKRLEIMGDPRIGAFGAMVLIFAIVGKIIVLAELIPTVSLIALAAVPIISRVGLSILSVTAKPAKTKGLAAYFQRLIDRKTILSAMFAWSLLMLAILYIFCGWIVAMAFLVVVPTATFAYKKWCDKNFGGVTGDLLGAYAEGMELLLWGMLLFFV
ncbi:adenosylcobinamide-GDP ribazoletransferase [Planococcus sp. A6]|uniref:adenosylcobinamide-GDP ribazoletransferase n=1 Tax=Planococcus sp. A6 TaxID=2992760 RepID=UPI00237BF8C6|nr:adenosylcobinamide-GDP ribazoletransferase [Planococcus sp. A6]MDE0582860.1 adenosylcobinamide-GDP ribazoletransferase [Planococcus sp. A6]